MNDQQFNQLIKVLTEIRDHLTATDISHDIGKVEYEVEQLRDEVKELVELVKKKKSDF